MMRNDNNFVKKNFVREPGNEVGGVHTTADGLPLKITNRYSPAAPKSVAGLADRTRWTCRVAGEIVALRKIDSFIIIRMHFLGEQASVVLTTARGIQLHCRRTITGDYLSMCAVDDRKETSSRRR